MNLPEQTLYIEIIRTKFTFRYVLIQDRMLRVRIFFPIFFFTSVAIKAYSQDPAEWRALEFNSIDDYRNNESNVLECARYVLDVPADINNPLRLSAMGVISKWMSGTPDYAFSLDETIMTLTKKNDVILSIYMAAMTKFALENKDKASNAGLIKLNAFQILLEYCEQPNNDVSLTKEISKAIKAKNSGKLKEYLDLK